MFIFLSYLRASAASMYAPGGSEDVLHAAAASPPAPVNSPCGPAGCGQGPVEKTKLVDQSSDEPSYITASGSDHFVRPGPAKTGRPVSRMRDVLHASMLGFSDPR